MENQPSKFTSKTALVIYLRLGLLASLLFLAIGLSLLLASLFAQFFGYSFSYYQPVYPNFPSGSSLLTPPYSPPAPNQQVLDLVSGVVTASIGILFGLVHLVAFRLTSKTSLTTAPGRFTSAFGAVLFGLPAVIALVSGGNALFSRLFVANSVKQPGGPLAFGLVFTLFWLYFLFRVIRSLRNQDA